MSQQLSARVRAVQQLLYATSPSLKVDGSLGLATLRAIASAPDPLRKRIVLMLDSDLPGVTIGVRLSDSDLVQLIAQAKAVTPRADAVKLSDESIIRMARVESDGNPSAHNAFYFGLFAMGRDAWADAVRRDPTLPDFSTGWRTALINMRAALLFWSSFQVATARVGLKVDLSDWRVVYALHNQGVAGFKNLVNTAGLTEATIIASTRESLGVLAHVGNQSREAKQIVAAAYISTRAIA